MTNVWRIHLIKDIPASPNYGNYCLEKKIAAVGWILDERFHDSLKAGKLEIKNYADYESCAKKCHETFHDVRRLAQEVQPGDFIWTCVDRKYYIARVSDNSRYNYNFSDEAIYYRACNELTEIDWKYVGDKSAVDERIRRRMERAQTLCRIFAEKNPMRTFAVKYSEEVYKKVSG